MNEFKKSLLVTAMMAVGMSSAHAFVATVTTTANTLVMVDASGTIMGDNGPVTFTWDGTYNTNVNTAVVNASLTNIGMGPGGALNPIAGSTFYGDPWYAHDIKVFSGAPTTYTFFAGSNPYTVTVGVNQVALTMLFDWGVNGNIEVVELCERGVFPTIPGGTPYNDSTSWDCKSVDGDGDGVPGFLMNNGPFAGVANANFNLMDLVAPTEVASGNTVQAVARAVGVSGGPSGGGGCAMDPAGRDGSLLFALLGGLGYAAWRRRRS